MFVGWRQALYCKNVFSCSPVCPLLLCIVPLHAGISVFLFCWGTFSFLQGAAGNYLDGRALPLSSCHICGWNRLSSLFRHLWFDIYLAASRKHNSLLQGANDNLDSHIFKHTDFWMTFQAGTVVQTWEQVFQVICVKWTLPSSLSRVLACSIGSFLLLDHIQTSFLCYPLRLCVCVNKTGHEQTHSRFEFSGWRSLWFVPYLGGLKVSTL